MIRKIGDHLHAHAQNEISQSDWIVHAQTGGREMYIAPGRLIPYASADKMGTKRPGSYLKGPGVELKICFLFIPFNLQARTVSKINRH